MQEPGRTGLNFVKQEGGPPHNAEHTFPRFSKREQTSPTLRSAPGKDTRYSSIEKAEEKITFI